MADTNPPRKSLSAFLIVVSVTSLILLLLGIALLLGAWHLEESNPFAMNWLVNLGAGFIGMAAATVVATLTGWVLARKKLKDLALPILRLIQELRFKAKISPEGARRAVVFAVTLMPEGSVTSAKLRQKDSAPQNCPVCFLKVDPGSDPKKRCSFCHIPGAIWSHEELTKDPAASAETAR